MAAKKEGGEGRRRGGTASRRRSQPREAVVSLSDAGSWVK